MIVECVICGNPIPADRGGKFTCGAQTCGPLRLPQFGRVVNTSIFKTSLPRDWVAAHAQIPGSRSFDYSQRHVREIDQLNDLAGTEMGKHGLTSNPTADDLLHASGPAYDAYHYRQLSQKLNEMAERFVSVRGRELLATLLFPDRPPRLTEFKLWAMDFFWQVVDTAVELGEYGDRMKVRAGGHEDAAVRARRSRVGLRAGNPAKQKTKLKTRDLVWDMARGIRTAHPTYKNNRIAPLIVKELAKKKIKRSVSAVRGYLADFDELTRKKPRR